VVRCLVVRCLVVRCLVVRCLVVRCLVVRCLVVRSLVCAVSWFAVSCVTREPHSPQAPTIQPSNPAPAERTGNRGCRGGRSSATARRRGALIGPLWPRHTTRCQGQAAARPREQPRLPASARHRSASIVGASLLGLRTGLHARAATTTPSRLPGERSAPDRCPPTVTSTAAFRMGTPSISKRSAGRSRASRPRGRWGRFSMRTRDARAKNSWPVSVYRPPDPPRVEGARSLANRIAGGQRRCARSITAAPPARESVAARTACVTRDSCDPRSGLPAASAPGPRSQSAASGAPRPRRPSLPVGCTTRDRGAVCAAAEPTRVPRSPCRALAGGEPHDPLWCSGARRTWKGVQNSTTRGQDNG